MRTANKAALALAVIGVGAILYGVILNYTHSPRRELTRYINQDMAEARKLEAEADRLFQEALRPPNAAGNLAGKLEEKVIPAYESLLAAVDRVKPESEKLREIHAVYREAVRLQLEGYTLMLDSLEPGAGGLRGQAGEIRNQGWNLTVEYMAKLRDYGATLGVIIQ